jgi:hypothetical protein
MSLKNLHLKREWIEDHKILAYTLYTLSSDLLEQWSSDLAVSLQEWQSDHPRLLLFNLSNPNVGMSYFVLNGRDLFHLRSDNAQTEVFKDYLQHHPDQVIKLALVLSRTMGSLLSYRTLSSDLHDGLNGKAFFSESDALRWLLIEDDSRARDQITQGVRYAEMIKAMLPKNVTGDLFTESGELRMLVNGSLEIVEIAEGKPVIIGRSSRADLDVTSHGEPALTVSRQHIQIILHEKHLFVVDLDSRNGTFVSNRKIPANEMVLLKREDLIRIGELSIVVLF